MTSCENEWRHDATLPYLFIILYRIIIIIKATLLDLFISNFFHLLLFHFQKPISFQSTNACAKILKQLSLFNKLYRLFLYSKLIN